MVATPMYTHNLNSIKDQHTEVTGLVSIVVLFCS